MSLCCTPGEDAERSCDKVSTFWKPAGRIVEANNWLSKGPKHEDCHQDLQYVSLILNPSLLKNKPPAACCN